MKIEEEHVFTDRGKWRQEEVRQEVVLEPGERAMVCVLLDGGMCQQAFLDESDKATGRIWIETSKRTVIEPGLVPPVPTEIRDLVFGEIEEGRDLYGACTFVQFADDGAESKGTLELREGRWVYVTPFCDPDQRWPWGPSELRAIADKLEALNENKKVPAATERGQVRSQSDEG